MKLLQIEFVSELPASLGELYGILLGGPSASTSLQRGEFGDTTGKFGIPTQNQYKVRFDDRIVIGDVTYKVTERPDWDYPNSMTGTPPPPAATETAPSPAGFTASLRSARARHLADADGCPSGRGVALVRDFHEAHPRG